MSPDRPGPNCAHGRTAVASGESVRVAARLWLALQAVDGYRRELATVLDAEIRSGVATVDPCPPVRCTGNVVFLQDREVHSEEQPVRVLSQRVGGLVQSVASPDEPPPLALPVCEA